MHKASAPLAVTCVGKQVAFATTSPAESETEMYFYIAINPKTKDFMVLEDGEDVKYPPDGYVFSGWPPFTCDLDGDPTEVVYVAMEHIKKCEEMRVFFISMN